MLNTERALYKLLRWPLDEHQVEKIFLTAYQATVRLSKNRTGITSNLQRISRHSQRRDLTPDELESTLQEIALVLTHLVIDNLKGPETWPEQTRSADLVFLPCLKDLLKQGRGAILLTPHFGNHALFMYALACGGMPVNAVYNFGTAFRSLEKAYPNLRLFDVGFAAADLLKTLRGSGVVMTLGDVDYFPDNRTADFFGAPFFPPHGPARLSLASGAPILPVYAVLEDSRWRLIHEPPIDPGACSQEQIESLILRSMERHIAARPGHWLMFRDAWDLPATSEELRRQLRDARSSRALLKLWESVRGPFQVP
jgi:lauroyl/myristoyl acyltransferase